ncbi:MAG: translation initiation factor IF-2 N-terminal domain-containing protein [Flavobacteriales bacterium]|nr:translation initiation factor IF-2 N-terminal domain-containing protein [Flavobacteriales bacterium]
MAEVKAMRLSKVAKELNVGIQTIVEFLAKKGHDIQANPNSKIDEDQYELLLKEFHGEKLVKEKSKKIEPLNLKKESVSIQDIAQEPPVKKEEEEEASAEILIKDASLTSEPAEEKTSKAKEVPELKILGKLDIVDKPKKGKGKTAETKEKS